MVPGMSSYNVVVRKGFAIFFFYILLFDVVVVKFSFS